MKAKHKADKKGLGRINRFYRTSISLSDRSVDWLHRYILVKYPNGKKVITRQHWEKERLAKGLPNLSMFYEIDNGSPIHIKAGTVKAAIRQVNKVAQYLPHGVKFQDMGGWVDYAVTIKVDNKNYDETNVKELLYNDLDKLQLPLAYRKLSGDKDFDRLVIKFRELGYFVSLEYVDENYYKYIKHIPRKNYCSAFVEGKGLRVGFCTENDGESYHSINGKVAIESEECFDKWSRVPYTILIPKDDEGVNEIIRVCDFVRDMENGYYSKNNTGKDEFKKYEYD